MAFTEPIAHVPAPWRLRGTIYTLATYIPPKDAISLSQNKHFLYTPLELNSTFSEGEMAGGLGMVQVIRYTESPVGPYDELVIVPGSFAWEDSTTKTKKRNARVTRIYVSQEKTCWNGRKNWNIPKHLADFKFNTLADGSLSIATYPYTANSSGVEATKSPSPFFSATFKPIPYLPAFPLSTSPAKWLGIDLALVQPPLPQGNGAYDELVGTEHNGWCKVTALEWSWRSRLGWWSFEHGKKEDAEQEPLLNGEEADNDGDSFHNWWPGLGKWNVGVVMEDACIEFPKGERWT